MNVTKSEASEVRSRYQARLSELKSEDNNLFDADVRSGAVRAEGFQAAFVEQGDSFAYVARQGKTLEYAVFTPDDEVKGGRLTEAGGSFERNTLASGLTSGHQSDYTEVKSTPVEPSQTAGFERVIGGLLDQALAGDGLIFETIRTSQATRYW